MDRLSRRSFIQTASVATGAVIAATPAALVVDQTASAAVATEPTRRVTTPTTPALREPVMAYVRSVERGEVTVMSGTLETTYHDPALVQRLMAAAPDHDTTKKGK